MLHQIKRPDCDTQFEGIKRLQYQMLEFACNPATPIQLNHETIIEAFGQEIGKWLCERLWSRKKAKTILHKRLVNLIEFAHKYPELHGMALKCFNHDINYEKHLDNTDFYFQFDILLSQEARNVIRPLMIAFYDPLLANGFPTCVHGQTKTFNRDTFVSAFWDINPNLWSCPACDGYRPEETTKKVHADTDHFFPKSIYPLLSVSATNLLPVCLHCNRTFKGDTNPIDQPLDAPLTNTFHPYHRPALPHINVCITRNTASV